MRRAEGTFVKVSAVYISARLCRLLAICMTDREKMSDSDPPAPRSYHNTFTEAKERTPLNQVMAGKPSSVQRLGQAVQRMALTSCRRACQLLCCPLGPLLCERVPCCQAHQLTEETKTIQEPLRTPPSTILILNISNSTLIDCVIGNDTYTPAVAESQPLMKESELPMHSQARCSCSLGQRGAAQTSASPPPHPSAEAPSINIHSSHLNCVIIGDNNYMHAEQSHPPDAEEL